VLPIPYYSQEDGSKRISIRQIFSKTQEFAERDKNKEHDIFSFPLMESRSRHGGSFEKRLLFLQQVCFAHSLLAAKRILPEKFKNITFDVLWEGVNLFQYIKSKFI
jgi:hypothetical protein